jgi:hypothetical protein
MAEKGREEKAEQKLSGEDQAPEPDQITVGPIFGKPQSEEGFQNRAIKHERKRQRMGSA